MLMPHDARDALMQFKAIALYQLSYSSTVASPSSSSAAATAVRAEAVSNDAHSEHAVLCATKM